MPQDMPKKGTGREIAWLLSETRVGRCQDNYHRDMSPPTSTYSILLRLSPHFSEPPRSTHIDRYVYSYVCTCNSLSSVLVLLLSSPPRQPTSPVVLVAGECSHEGGGFNLGSARFCPARRARQRDNWTLSAGWRWLLSSFGWATFMEVYRRRAQGELSMISSVTTSLTEGRGLKGSQGEEFEEHKSVGMMSRV
ncbi:hypothetical protein N656DRAFT_433087 [Canariomyces notabilis]|uniref:Uncharacterized protein n=1 Tax=Canariomyces notabilis TaxID=2074819 RepID=A0AAN6QJY4_9PEZI|nr:hypothetical protein N656DRAFT_433087 [Canariomyces arenarius]